METLLITGANRGIGLELSRAFAAADWRVHACCRRPDAATELQRLAERQPAVQIHPLDVTDPAQIDRLSRQLADASIDILLNNAGISGPRAELGQIGVEERDAWLQVFATNSIAPWMVAQAFVDQVARSGRKTIATISSLMGSIGDNQQGGRVIYRSSKTAVNQVMKCLSLALTERQITVVMLHPGWVRTDMGGPEAPLPPADSAGGLQRLLTGLTPEHTGRFFDYTGRELPW